MEISRFEDEREMAAARLSAEARGGDGASPATRRASDDQKMNAILICGGIAFLTASLGAVAGNHWPKIVAFLPVYQTIVIFAYVVTGYLIFAQYQATRSLALLYLCGGCLYTAAIMLAQFMTFPGMFLEQGPLFGGSQTTIWLWCFWHAGPSLGILFYVLSEWRRPNYVVGTTKPALRSFVISLGLVFAATIATVTVFHEYLPVLDVKGYFGRIVSTGIGPAIELLTAAVLFLLWRMTKFRTVLQVWLGVALFALLCDNLMTMLGGDRLSIGWYVGRLYALISAVVLMFLYLSEIKRAYIRSADMAQQMAAAYAQLEVGGEQGLVDDLTGLPGRDLFLQQAEDLRTRNSVKGISVAVLFLDIDGFKAINDQFGDRHGDSVLVQVADAVRGCLRDTDIAGRLDGDEFVVCLTGPSAYIDVKATRVAESIVEGIGQIGCSVGIKTCDADRFVVETALRHAEKAMYAAKKRGKTRATAALRPRLAAVS